MRTQLPTTFAELCIVYLDQQGQLAERSEKFLISSFEPDSLLCINVAGASQRFPMFLNFVDEILRVSKVCFLSDEDDEYYDFVSCVHHADAMKELERLGSIVQASFKKIMSVEPADTESLWKALAHFVLEQNDTDSE